MSTLSNAQSTEVGHVDCQNVCADTQSHQSSLKVEEEEEEEEDEDVDFNPFSKETLSPEASSSLSSEIDGLDVDVVDSGGMFFDNGVGINLSKPTSEVQRSVVGDSEHGEVETVMQATVSPEGERIAKFCFQKPQEQKTCLNLSTKNWYCSNKRQWHWR